MFQLLTNEHKEFYKVIVIVNPTLQMMTLKHRELNDELKVRRLGETMAGFIKKQCYDWNLKSRHFDFYIWYKRFSYVRV